jgi:hypothetical protein
MSLDWDELEFLTYLDVMPDVGEYDVYHTYELVQDHMRLFVTVLQFESVVNLALYQESSGKAAVDLWLFVRGSIRYINDKRGQYLCFGDCVVAPSRFWYQTAGDLFDRQRIPIGLTVHLEVKPQILVRLVP